jgi:hypothetical protein
MNPQTNPHTFSSFERNFSCTFPMRSPQIGEHSAGTSQVKATLGGAKIAAALLSPD